MPEYEYRCKKCEQVFAIERSMSDLSPVNCIHCKSNNLARIWGASILANNIGGAKLSGASTPSQGEACASNPSKPKSCCPCG